MALPKSSIGLDGQHRFGTVCRQLGVEGVDRDGDERIVTHGQRQFDQALLAELLDRRLERAAAHPVCAVELLAVIDDGCFVGGQRRELFAVSEGVHHGVGHSGGPGRGGMGVPDVHTVILTSCD